MLIRMVITTGIFVLLGGNRKRRKGFFRVVWKGRWSAVGNGWVRVYWELNSKQQWLAFSKTFTASQTIVINQRFRYDLMNTVE